MGFPNIRDFNKAAKRLVVGAAMVLGAAGAVMAPTSDAHAQSGSNFLGDLIQSSIKDAVGHGVNAGVGQVKILEGMAAGKAAGVLAKGIGVDDAYSDCVSSTTTQVYSQGGSYGNSASNTANQITQCVDQKRQVQQRMEANRVAQEEWRTRNMQASCDQAFQSFVMGNSNAATAVNNCQAIGWKPPTMGR